MSAPIPPPAPDAAKSSAPDSHGRFSLNEDWTATLTGLTLLGAALLGLLPDIGEWF